jgi:hypothetical protein
MRVTFDSQGDQLVGTLYLPANAAAATAPAVIVTGSWLTVKEQMPANYAPKLAEAGFVALTFDFRGFGESAGAPREVESAARKADDIRAAARFLRTHPAVDGARVGALPICATAGYTAVLCTQDDPGLAAVAMVAPWLHDTAIVEALYGGTAAVAQRLDAARAARATFEATGEVVYVKAVSNTDPTAAMYAPGDIFDYYLNARRGAVPAWGGRFAVMAWTEWFGFDPIAIAPKVRVPTRIITGPQTATPGGAAAFASRLTAPHDVVSLPGTQFDFYDDPATVGAAAASAIAYFRTAL